MSSFYFNKQQLLFVCLFVIFSLHFGALHSLFIQYYSGILGMIRKSKNNVFELRLESEHVTAWKGL